MRATARRTGSRDHYGGLQDFDDARFVVANATIGDAPNSRPRAWRRDPPLSPLSATGVALQASLGISAGPARPTADSALHMSTAFDAQRSTRRNVNEFKWAFAEVLEAFIAIKWRLTKRNAIADSAESARSD